ncbi:MAG: hypothetical protein H6718_18115 [Polyangiaceae bacterium]|nr:hypothetical protein [Polyangiaceae bacterium]
MSGKKVVRKRTAAVPSEDGRRKRWLWLVPVCLVAGGYWLLRSPEAAPEPQSKARATAQPTQAPVARRAEPAIRKAPARSVRQSEPETGGAATRPAAVAAQVPLVTTPKVAPRTAQLDLQVMQEAQKYGWVYTDDSETPCPPQRVRIVWDVPGDLADYNRGAYFEPLGPAPSESSTSVNGLLLCEGSNFLYRGFEAYYDEDRAQWRVYPFPVIEAAPGEE